VVYVRLKRERERESGELELDTGSHARARSCDADVTTTRPARGSFFEDFTKVWNSVKKGGYINGMRLVWGEGMEDFGRGWEKLYKEEFSPDEGLVFSLVEHPTGEL
jgi:hypothetical protein